MIQLLVERKATISEEHLMDAVRICRGNYKIIKMLLQYYPVTGGVIGAAAWSGDLNLLQLVLSYVAEADKKKLINDKDKFGRTPLMESVFNGQNLELTAFLIQMGAEVDTQDKDKNTALSLAASVSVTDSQTVLYLLKNDANPNLANIRGETPRSRIKERRKVYEKMLFLINPTAERKLLREFEREHRTFALLPQLLQQLGEK